VSDWCLLADDGCDDEAELERAVKRESVSWKTLGVWVRENMVEMGSSASLPLFSRRYHGEPILSAITIDWALGQ
jgi:hypothetical protein